MCCMCEFPLHPKAAREADLHNLRARVRVQARMTSAWVEDSVLAEWVLATRREWALAMSPE